MTRWHAIALIVVITTLVGLINWNNDRVRDEILREIAASASRQSKQQQEADDEIEQEIEGLTDDELLGRFNKWVHKTDPAN